MIQPDSEIRASGGPLTGIRVVELAGLGSGPMCAMLLADLGAEVVRVDRPEGTDLGVDYDPSCNLTNRSRPSIALDLAVPEGVAVMRRLVEEADALIEVFRPGVAERLGIGPDSCLEWNPRLVYGRLTGWGQRGPLAQQAGHDINYIAVTGALDAIGRAGGPPVPPLNLVGNVGGGALYLAFGICAALLERGRSGLGQVIDAAIVDGAASMMTHTYGLRKAGLWPGERGTNAGDTGSHFYNTYETSDGKWVAVAASESKFHDELLLRLDLTAADIPDRWDSRRWPEYTATLQARFLTRTQAEWCAALDGSDACVAPILPMDEAPAHPHLRARRTFVEVDGVVQPGPAPRFSRTPGAISRPPSVPGADTQEALATWGFAQDEIEQLRSAGVIGTPSKRSET